MTSDNHVTNCSTNVELNGAYFTGGTAGLLYETTNTTFSGSTWPSAYPEIGYGSADNNVGNTNNNTSEVGGSGGGCNEGFGMMILLGLLALKYSQRH